MIAFASKARPFLGALVLTTALLCAGGVYSYTRMPSGVYPEVTFPRIAVVATVPDRDVTSMELQVTQPLEKAVASVIGVSQVRSKTIRGGSELSIVFNPGTDMRRAEQLTWNRISARRSDLPANTDLAVEQMTPSVFPIMSVVLTGGDSMARLRDYAYYQLAPQIKHVPDVLYANVAGGDIREIEVIARPDDLLARGLSAADLADQISQTDLLLPVGRSESQPFAYQILVNNQASTPRQIEELVISTKKGQPIRVKDVADVKVLHQDRLLSIGSDLKDAVVISVFRRLGGNTQKVSEGVRELLARTGLDLPAGDTRKPPPRNIQANVVYDQARFVETAVANVRDAILIGGFFSVLILLGFLRSWRATLISALAIPTTLAITFLFLDWTGQTLNLMSLGGLAVAIGLIIDDTVVVVENIARHLTPGASHEPAAGPAVPPEANGRDGHAVAMAVRDPVDAASSEITGAVVGSTFTTVLVFLPLAFIVGVYGQFFAALSWSLSVAVLVSMVISLTLVPVFAARFLAGRPMPPPGPVYRLLAHLYEMLLAGALWAAERLLVFLEWVLGLVGLGRLKRWPAVLLLIESLVFLVPVCALGVVLFTGIPDPWAVREPEKPPPAPLVKGLETGLMPAMDEGSFVLDYWAPSGAPLAQTEAMAREVEKIIAKNPDVESYVRRTGSENGIFATKTSRGDITIVLRRAEEDPRTLFIEQKPIRPPLEKLEAELKQAGLKLESADGKKYVRDKYRRRPVTKVMEEVEDEVKDNFAEHQFKIEIVQMMQDELDDLSGANKPIEVKLFGTDHRVLRSLAEQVGETLEKKGKGRGIKEVNSNVFQGNPDLMIHVDLARANNLGIKPDAVARQYRAISAGQIAASVPESAVRITDIRVRYPDSIRFGGGRMDPERVLRQLILLPGDQTAAGTLLPGPARAVPLSALATLTPVRTPDEQWRENQQPMLFVTAEIKEDEAGLGSVVNDIQNWMSQMSLPAGCHWDMGGHYQQQREAFRSLLVVMVVAVLLVFIMLAFQFRSLVLPFLIFMTQPLSLVSGLLALWLTNTPLNVSSYMGAILLIGLDMKNGILLVEYIQQLRAEGMELHRALLEAGRTRFRPILMTSLAAILGLFPLALGIGPGAQMQQPLAIMVIGGLTANMLFTRVVIPVGYLVLERDRSAAPAVAAPPPPTPVAVALSQGETS
jgi:multidrug efflux pump subunit AcrB